jgi:hypothetical protein
VHRAEEANENGPLQRGEGGRGDDETNYKLHPPPKTNIKKQLNIIFEAKIAGFPDMSIVLTQLSASKPASASVLWPK